MPEQRCLADLGRRNVRAMSAVRCYARLGEYPDAVTETVPAPHLVIDDEEIFAAHVGGKLSVELKAPLDTQRALSIAYTPGVAQVSRAIAADHTLAARYTWAHRLVAVVSDGSAVLGLGDIGPSASLPVMEGKSALFKTFAGLDSIPIVLDTKDPDEIVDILIKLRPTFGAVNLEDISAPRCFEIERRVIEALDCPVMHDDQHGTAIVVLAALLGATTVLERDMSSLKMVISGAGAAGRGVRQHPAGQRADRHHRAGLQGHRAQRPRRPELRPRPTWPPGPTREG